MTTNSPTRRVFSCDRLNYCRRSLSNGAGLRGRPSLESTPLWLETRSNCGPLDGHDFLFLCLPLFLFLPRLFYFLFTMMIVAVILRGLTPFSSIALAADGLLDLQPRLTGVPRVVLCVHESDPKIEFPLYWEPGMFNIRTSLVYSVQKKHKIYCRSFTILRFLPMKLCGFKLIYSMKTLNHISPDSS